MEGNWSLLPLFFSPPTFVQDLTKDQKRKYDYSKQKMDTADRDCRLYSVDGILQAGIGCGVKSSSYAVMQIEAVDKEFSSSYSASIRGRQDIDIYPQVSGTIEKLCVTEGQKNAGDNYSSLSTRFLTRLH